jgi:hypothetical protein
MAVDVDQTVEVFAQDWFDLLSRHAPVAELLPFVLDQGLEMIFPERTLRGHRDFAEWYAAVGDSYTDQSHEITSLAAVPDGDRTSVAVTVVWRAAKTADGSRLALRVHQSWRLGRHAPGGRPVIERYQVLSMDPA